MANMRAQGILNVNGFRGFFSPSEDNSQAFRPVASYELGQAEHLWDATHAFHYTELVLGSCCAQFPAC